jgi:uncharacterized protein (DUF302 family)
LNTAIEAIKNVIPNATVTNSCHDDYPIKVTISAILDDDEKVIVWTGSQKNLFRKYRDQRTQAIQEIVENIRKMFDVNSKL